MSSFERRDRNDFDVAVVGQGLAGVFSTLSLDNSGFSVAAIEKRGAPPEKSLFVNARWWDERIFDQILRDGYATPIRNCQAINVDNGELGWEKMRDDKEVDTFALSHPGAIETVEENYSENVTRIRGIVERSSESDIGVELKLRSGEKLSADYLIDASGDYSLVSRRHQVNGSKALIADDPLVYWVKGVKAEGRFIQNSIFIPVGRELGLGWILPYSGTHGDLVTGEWCRMSDLDPRRQREFLKRFVEFCENRGLCEVERIKENVVGFIRCNPIGRDVVRKTKRVFQVGSAAGMTSPLMAEASSSAVYWGARMGEVISKGMTPERFYLQWRYQEQMFPYCLELAMLHRRMASFKRKGEYGSNTPICDAVIRFLPEGVQEEVLTNRTIPRRYLYKLVPAIMRDPKLLPNLLELGGHWFKVQCRDVVNNRV